MSSPGASAGWRPSPALSRLAPTLLTAAIGAAYVIVSPPSLDLAAHLLRAKLFATEGFGLWNNWWYGGHNTPGYSVLFPPLAAALTPQVVGALSVVATTAVFGPLARAYAGAGAWVGTLWFGAGITLDLFTGRLTFAFGLVPAVATALALQRRRDGIGVVLAVITALASPVAALFAALAGVAAAYGRLAGERAARRTAAQALGVAAAALIPVGILTVLFPEGGSEPFTFATLWPILVIAPAMVAALPKSSRALIAGIVLFLAGCVLAYAIPTPVGSNAARLGPLLAGPLAALALWPRHRRLLALAALPLLYIQWQAPVRDLTTSWGDPSISAGYYRPVLDFLARQPGAPFRVEIPFTKFHWEAYQVAPRFALARGWERQLDIRDNALFYSGTLTAARYRTWLHTLAVRYIAVDNGPVDYSAKREVDLIDRGVPYLRLVWQSRNWRVYTVTDPSSLAQGAASATALLANQVTLKVKRPGTALIRVRFSPYWALSGVPGCVAPAGDFTRATFHRAGTARLVIRFAFRRAGARSPRCNSATR